MLGGLARRVAFVEKEKASGKPALVVDSGDLFFDGRIREKSHPDLAKARIISRAYRKMGAIALNVGDLDLLHGVEFLVQLANEGLPLISANLVNAKDSSTLFPPFRIHEAAGLRNRLRESRRAIERYRDRSAWDRWPLFAAIVLALCLEWYARKRSGLP